MVIPGPSQDAKRGLHQKTNVRFTRLEAEVRAGKVANLSDTWMVNLAIEIVDFPIKNGDFPLLC